MQTASGLDFETTSSYNITIRVTDNGGAGLTYDEGFTINITDVNEAPTDIALSANNVDENVTLGTVVGTLSPTDVDAGDTHTYSIVGGSAEFNIVGTSLQTASGLDFETTSSYNITIRVTDNGGAGLSYDKGFTINVTDVNEAPVIAAISTLQVIENTTLNHTVSVSDVEGDGITYALDGTSTGKGMAIDGSGILTWTPGSEYLGDHTVTVTATDDGIPNESDTEMFTITVAVEGTPTVDQGISNQSATEDATFNFTIPSDAFADPDGAVSALTFAAKLADDSALPGWLTFSTDQFSGTPQESDAGMINIRVTATDANSKTVSTTFDLTVSTVNDAPVFTTGADPTVNEDAGAQSLANWATGIEDGDGEVIQGLTFMITNNTNAGLFSVAPAISSAGTLTYTADANANGSATITVKLSDDGGTANGGENESGSQNFTITVAPVNDVPAFVAGGNESITEDAGAQTIAGWATSISDGDAEVTQNLTFTIINNTNPTLFSTAPAISSAGTLTYTSAENANGSAIITFKLSDDGGGANESATQEFTITVNGVNDAPVIATISTLQVVENATLSYPVDVSDEEGDGITYALDGTSTGKGMAINTEGVLSWTPNSSHLGDHMVTVTATDDGTPNENDTETFTITVAPEGTPMVDQGISNQTATEDAAFSFTILANAFADPDGDVSALVYTSRLEDGSDLPGWLKLTDGTFTGTPLNADAGVSITIKVTATDTDGNSVPTTFTLSVAAVNDKPVIATVNDQEIAEGELLTLTVEATDEEGNTLTYALDASSIGKGMAITAGTGSFSWTPATGDVGIHTVVVTVSDDGTPSAAGSSSFTITVTSQNGAPVAIADAYDTMQDDILTVEAATGVLFNDTDADGDELNAELKTTTANGALSLERDGAFTYTPNAGFSGSDSFSYAASDGTLESGIVEVTITISPSTVTSIGGNISESSVNLYPIPFQQTLNVEVKKMSRGSVTLSIFDLSGKMLQSRVIEHQGGTFEYQLEIENKKQGLFLLEIRKDDGTSMIKRVVSY